MMGTAGVCQLLPDISVQFQCQVPVHFPPSTFYCASTPAYRLCFIGEACKLCCCHGFGKKCAHEQAAFIKNHMNSTPVSLIYCVNMMHWK